MLERSRQGFPQGCWLLPELTASLWLDTPFWNRDFFTKMGRKEKGVHQKGTDTYNGFPPHF